MKDQYYTGKALTPPVTVKHGKKLLVEGTDYTATYRNNVKVGTARVTLKGAGRYTGTLKVTFGIQARIKLSKCKATVKDQVYTGKAIKPAVTVKYGKQTLKQGRDYTVTFKNNKKVGTATAVLKGAGRYTGTKKLTFAINPAAPAIAGLKAGKGKLTVKWEARKGITGYELQYGLKKKLTDAKTVKVKAAATGKVLSKLASGKKVYVRLRVYRKVGKKTYRSAWSAIAAAKVK